MGSTFVVVIGINLSCFFITGIIAIVLQALTNHKRTNHPNFLLRHDDTITPYSTLLRFLKLIRVSCIGKKAGQRCKDTMGHT
jgi:hypothetical protein